MTQNNTTRHVKYSYKTTQTEKLWWKLGVIKVTLHQLFVCVGCSYRLFLMQLWLADSCKNFQIWTQTLILNVQCKINLWHDTYFPSSSFSSYISLNLGLPVPAGVDIFSCFYQENGFCSRNVVYELTLGYHLHFTAPYFRFHTTACS